MRECGGSAFKKRTLLERCRFCAYKSGLKYLDYLSYRYYVRQAFQLEEKVHELALFISKFYYFKLKLALWSRKILNQST